MDRIPDLLIVGTDTGVGKSVISMLMMRLLFRQGFRPFYVKPFQTGCRDAYDSQSDAAFVYRHTPELKGCDPAQSVVYCFPNPKAPYFAARDAATRIDPDVVAGRVAKHRRQYHPLVVEAAGGLMVPVTEKYLVVDLIERFECRPLLVARAGLGTINHTLLSIEMLRRRGAMPMGVVLVERDYPGTDPQMVAENRAAVETHGGLPVWGTIPRIEDFDDPPESVFLPLKQVLSDPATAVR